MSKKHKSHPEGEIICPPLCSPISARGHVIYNAIYITKWKLHLSLQWPFRE